MKLSSARRRVGAESVSELPAWGLEIMMGLYGPQTIRAALAAEATSRHADAQAPVSVPVGSVPAASVPTDHDVDDPVGAAVPIGELGSCCWSPAMSELAAITALGDAIRRMFRRN